MKFWVDGDSCPSMALALLLRRCGGGPVVEVVADRPLARAEEAGALVTVLPRGSGETDRRILEGCRRGDAAVTRDLDLAARLLEKGVTVVSDRGRVWTKPELALRIQDAALMGAMRAGKMVRPQKRDYSRDDAAAFAAALDRILAEQPQAER